MMLNPCKMEGMPCLFSGTKLIVFFYVDIVVLIHPSKLNHHPEFQKWLMRAYDLRRVSGKGITGRDTILSRMILYQAA